MLRYLQVDHWLEFSARRLCGQAGLTVALAELDKALSLRTFLVGHALTLADISVWASLKGWCSVVGNSVCPYTTPSIFCSCSAVGHVEWPGQAKAFSHVNRWFFFLNSQVPFSAVGNRFTKKNLPLTKSNASVMSDIYFAAVLAGRQEPPGLVCAELHHHVMKRTT